MLIDELLSCLGAMTSNSDLTIVLATGLVQAVRFQVDNVAEYVCANYGGQRPFHGEKEIPNIAPLAPYMWFEYSSIQSVHRKASLFGCYISIDYVRDEFQTSKWAAIDNIHAETKWILRAEYFAKTREGYGCSDWIYFFEADGQGQIIGVRAIPNHFYGSDTPKNYVPDEAQCRVWHEEITVALTSICFSHCKGAEIEEHKPSRQVRRAAERKGEPVFSYHTIDIHPATRVLRDEGNIEKNGIVKALHICRGHFAHYTSEKPLFGKYTGTFYRPMHTRGSAEQGIAGKDYRVHAR